MFCNMYVANNSSILQYCHGMSIEGVLVFYRTTEYANSWEGGGGLTARRKRKSSLLRPPPPLFFLKVGRKRGGGVTAGQYGMCSAGPEVAVLDWYGPEADPVYWQRGRGGGGGRTPGSV